MTMNIGATREASQLSVLRTFFAAKSVWLVFHSFFGARLAYCKCWRCWRWHEGIDGFCISLSAMWWQGKWEVFNRAGTTTAIVTHKTLHPFRDFRLRMEDIPLKNATIKHEWALCSELNSSTELLRRPLTIQNKLTSSFWLSSRKYSCEMYSSINVDVLYVTVRLTSLSSPMSSNFLSEETDGSDDSSQSWVAIIVSVRPCIRKGTEQPFGSNHLCIYLCMYLCNYRLTNLYLYSICYNPNCL